MKKIRLLYGSIVFLLIFSACSTKNFVYLHEDNYDTADTNKFAPAKTAYYIQSSDVLYINFHSVLSDAENFFKHSNINEANIQVSEEAMYINQYVVSDSGYIKIPVIGLVYVAGKTVTDIEKTVEQEAQKFISDATVKVKMVNFKITFLGEFGKPGEMYFYRDNVNILDAIAVAGDLTYDGDRKNIRIIRQTPDGVETFRVDLNNIKLLDSKDYFLKPNDIVYAEPLSRKIFRLRSADYSILLLTVTSTLALASLIISLQK